MGTRQAVSILVSCVWGEVDEDRRVWEAFWGGGRRRGKRRGKSKGGREGIDRLQTSHGGDVEIWDWSYRVKIILQ